MQYALPHCNGPFVSSGARCELARRCFRWLEKVLGKTEPVVAAPAPP